MLTVSEMLKLSLEYVLDKYYVDYSTHNNNGGGGVLPITFWGEAPNGYVQSSH